MTIPTVSTTDAETLFPAAVTPLKVMVASPLACALTTPVEDTVNTSELLELQDRLTTAAQSMTDSCRSSPTSSEARPTFDGPTIAAPPIATTCSRSVSRLFAVLVSGLPRPVVYT